MTSTAGLPVGAPDVVGGGVVGGGVVGGGVVGGVPPVPAMGVPVVVELWAE